MRRRDSISGAGAILASKHWTLLLNFLLATGHKVAEISPPYNEASVQIACSTSADQQSIFTMLLDNARDYLVNRPTVTGLELVSLYTVFGYELVISRLPNKV